MQAYMHACRPGKQAALPDSRVVELDVGELVGAGSEVEGQLRDAELANLRQEKAAEGT